MELNSTSLKNVLEVIADEAGTNIKTDITDLARQLNVTVPVLISVLTELEHRDEIIMEISATPGNNNEPEYSGTVRLMDTPPDEKSPLTVL